MLTEIIGLILFELIVRLDVSASSSPFGQLGMIVPSGSREYICSFTLAKFPYISLFYWPT